MPLLKTIAGAEVEADAAQDTQSLAASLAPVLHQICDGRLGELTWFRTDWQRGGAATAFSTYTDDEDQTTPVVVKLPVAPRELIWTQRLQAPDHSDAAAHDSQPVVARLLASGTELAGYDLAWMVIERFEHGPLGLHWHENHIPRIAEAMTRFHEATERYPIDAPPRREEWDDLLRDARESVKVNKPANPQRWNTTLKKLGTHLDDIVVEWRGRPIGLWVHGDLHIANAMSRVGADDGPVSLIDLAEVHPGHWIEDAVFFERQFWATPQRTKKHKPMRCVVEARKRLGLSVDETYPRLAAIRRALLAATAPRYMKSEGHPAYLDACLNRLEQSLNELR